MCMTITRGRAALHVRERATDIRFSRAVASTLEQSPSAPCWARLSTPCRHWASQRSELDRHWLKQPLSLIAKDGN